MRARRGGGGGVEEGEKDEKRVEIERANEPKGHDCQTGFPVFVMFAPCLTSSALPLYYSIYSHTPAQTQYYAQKKREIPRVLIHSWAE